MKRLILGIFLLTSLVCLSSTKYVVLIPGAASSAERIWLKGLNSLFGPIHQEQYFKHLKEELFKNNFNTFVCPVISDRDTRSLRARTLDCSSYLMSIKTYKKDIEFHLVGHSMGGLVARSLLSDSNLFGMIKSITTISTPHLGTPLADFVLRHDKNKSPMARLLRTFEFSPDIKYYIKDLIMLRGGNTYISNLRNPMRIPVFSISNYKTNTYNVAMSITQRYLTKELRKYYPEMSAVNDGIVPTESQLYGTHLGTIKADHMESACVFYSQITQGCRNTLNLLIPHLKKIIK